MTTITNNFRFNRTRGSSALIALFIGVLMAFVMGLATPNVASAVYYDGYCVGCGDSFSDYSYTPYSYSDYSYTPYSYSDYSYTPYTYSDYSYVPYTYSDYSYIPYTYSDYSYDYSYEPYYPSYSPVYSDPYYYGSYGSYYPSYNVVYTDYYYDTPRYNPPTYNPPRYDDPVDCTLSASDTRIEEGDSVTLRWDTENADDVYINQGIGNVSRSGSERVTLRRDTTFTLTAENRDDRETCSITIRVDEEEDDDLWCELDASRTRIDEGDSVTLEWDTRGDVRDARINQGIGSVDEDGGTERVRPNRDTTYRLTIEGRNGDEEDCSVTVRVDDDSLPPPPDVPLVYLSQLPYTGAEDSMMYWMLLIVGSGVVGYMLFFRVIPFAYARLAPQRSETTLEEKPVGEGEETASVTRQDVRAFVSALAERDTTSAYEFARSGKESLFAETAVILDDALRARESGTPADPMVQNLTKDWDSSKFAALIEAFADAKDESVVEKAIA